ncbi:hypothetical protein COCNU_scaffold000669G000030 [Cocos nucifera]|nr:hypothetical protein [Cocos nucifera]
MGKKKSTMGARSSKAPKKSLLDAPLVATHPTDPPSVVIGPTDVPSIEISNATSEMVVALAALAGLPSAQDALVEAPHAVKESDDDVMVVKAPTAPIEPVISRVPSMSKGKAPTTFIKSEAPTGLAEFINIQVPAGESALSNPTLAKQLVKAILLPIDRWSRKSRILANMFSSFYSSVISGWSDKAKVTIVEKNATLEHLRAMADHDREVKEREEKLAEEVSCLRAKLESAPANWGSANFEPKSMHSKLESPQADLESAKWIIETQESQIQRKRHDVN